MSYYEYNPYYSPEALGLEIIAALEYSDGNYQFDTRVVWRHIESGKFYTARDSGCSCPSPFEEYTKLADLDELTDWTELQSEYTRELDLERRSFGGNPHLEGEGATFVGTVRREMLKNKRTRARQNVTS